MQTVKKYFNTVVRYLREVKIEMKRVNWLTKREVLNYTLLVIAVSIGVGIYLGSLDILFQWVLSKVI